MQVVALEGGQSRSTKDSWAGAKAQLEEGRVVSRYGILGILLGQAARVLGSQGVAFWLKHLREPEGDLGAQLDSDPFWLNQVR